MDSSSSPRTRLTWPLSSQSPGEENRNFDYFVDCKLFCSDTSIGHSPFTLFFRLESAVEDLEGLASQYKIQYVFTMPYLDFKFMETIPIF